MLQQLLISVITYSCCIYVLCVTLFYNLLHTQVIFGSIFFSYYLILGVNSQTMIDPCGNDTNVMSSYNSTVLSVDAPFYFILTDFEEDVYIPEELYFCKCQLHFSVITCVHNYIDCCQCTCDQAMTQSTVTKGLQYKQEQQLMILLLVILYPMALNISYSVLMM